MAGLPRKYAKMGFKKGWKAYRASKGKTKKKASPSPAKKGKPMVRRRARKAYRKFARSRTNTIPLIDGLQAVYTLDGMSGNRASLAVGQAVGVVTGKTASLDLPLKTAQDGLDYAMADPKRAVVGGVKNFAMVYLGRKVLGFIGIPKSVKLFGKYRLQVR